MALRPGRSRLYASLSAECGALCCWTARGCTRLDATAAGLLLLQLTALSDLTDWNQHPLFLSEQRKKVGDLVETWRRQDLDDGVLCDGELVVAQ